jgi:hypothetical protein
MSTPALAYVAGIFAWAGFVGGATWAGSEAG